MSVTKAEEKRLELDRKLVLEALAEATFRGESVEGIVRSLDGRDDPSGIVEVRQALNWLLRQGLVTEDQEVTPARFHRARKTASSAMAA